MTPEFSRLAARVLNAPYFYTRAASQDRGDVVAHQQALLEERDLLLAAVHAADAEGDLDAQARAVWDRARDSLQTRPEPPTEE